MGGCGERRVAGRLHLLLLLLLAAVWSVPARGAAPWTEEKVGERCGSRGSPR